MTFGIREAGPVSLDLPPTRWTERHQKSVLTVILARKTIDKEAANRFIKGALAGNKDGNYLTKMAENSEETATHKRFEDEEAKSSTKKRSNDDSDVEEVSPPKEQKYDEQKPKKKKSKSKK